jgi:hypothetical protein
MGGSPCRLFSASFATGACRGPAHHPLRSQTSAMRGGTGTDATVLGGPVFACQTTQLVDGGLADEIEGERTAGHATGRSPATVPSARWTTRGRPVCVEPPAPRATSRHREASASSRRMPVAATPQPPDLKDTATSTCPRGDLNSGGHRCMWMLRKALICGFGNPSTGRNGVGMHPGAPGSLVRSIKISITTARHRLLPFSI